MSQPEVLGVFPEVIAIYKFGREFERAYADLHLIAQELTKDGEECNRGNAQAPNSQFWRRTSVRVIFSMIEATVFGLKRLAWMHYSSREVDFSQAELAMLREEKYALRDNGEAKVQENSYPPFIPNFKFAFKMFARAHGNEFEIAPSGMQKLHSAFDIRNRLTHPKNPEDLVVSDAESSIVSEMWDWFSAEFLRLLAENDESRLPVKPIVNVTSRFKTIKPVILLWPDGTVYGFDDPKACEDFLAKSNPPDSALSVALFLHDGDWVFLKPASAPDGANPTI